MDARRAMFESELARHQEILRAAEEKITLWIAVLKDLDKEEAVRQEI